MKNVNFLLTNTINCGERERERERERVLTEKEVMANML